MGRGSCCRHLEWTPVYDQYGRPAVWQPRIPDGMAYVVHYIHRLGLKVGIYMPAGMETGKEGDNRTVGQHLSKHIYGAPQCTLADAIYPDQRTMHDRRLKQPLRVGLRQRQRLRQGLHRLDRQPVPELGRVDLVKLDGVGPGSGHNEISGDNARTTTGRSWPSTTGRSRPPAGTSRSRCRGG